MDDACRFTCPYHGWTYDAQGRLVKATKVKGMHDFKPRDYGLLPLQAEQWLRHLTMLKATGDAGDDSFERWVGASSVHLIDGGQ